MIVKRIIFVKMCLVAFALSIHPKYELVMVFNRDEEKSRGSEPIHWLNNEILAGRDEKDGGSWFGITRHGRIAYLTNFRNPETFREDAKSRGHIVKSFLVSNLTEEDFVKRLRSEIQEYNDFNLIFGVRPNRLFYFSNITDKLIRIKPGIHGLSNGLLDEPWPKVVRLKKMLESKMSKNELTVVELLGLLKDRAIPPPDELPNTGVGLELEMKLSPIFVDFEGYGTVSSTVLLIDRGRNVILRERRFVEPITDLVYRFKILDVNDGAL